MPQLNWIGRDDVGLHFVLDMDGTFGGMREVGDLALSGELPATIGRRPRSEAASSNPGPVGHSPASILRAIRGP
ncbi:hypothetical protein [Micromonospora sp. MA102]|uniref:hypothetical protein n=1 Tax=Micromonospora sp. MA102 TaxID=2952755 RepID=UPI0021C9696E|nr:hypothetical protein [Micromonospora sp. MA102]